eukprot:TRINITY_DN7119_c0_g2_i1.p2 TRINITY_DN7119_c0_g2~~TRINITY_DN7119_c0_g2_i1.p2  ORF type:complete len:135 (-),score=14.69 TRINITY_DN7119_c0_g2_i1:163-540(-)
MRKVRNLASFLASFVTIFAKKEEKLTLRRFARKVELWTQLNSTEVVFWVIFFQKLFNWKADLVKLQDLLEDVRGNPTLQNGMFYFLSKQFRKSLKDRQQTGINQQDFERIKSNWEIVSAILGREA